MSWRSCWPMVLVVGPGASSAQSSIELSCALPALDDAGVAFGAGFAMVVAPAVIAYGGAILIRAIGAMR